MTTTNKYRTIASERRLEWLLHEHLRPGDLPEAAPIRSRQHQNPLQQWLLAAAIVLGAGVLGGVYWLQPRTGASDAWFAAVARDVVDQVTQSTAQDPEIVWYEALGPATAAQIPDDVVNLRCYDFHDAALASLGRLQRLERLDLGLMQVDGQGVARSLTISDAGIANLRDLRRLRWLSLSQCHNVRGPALAMLAELPQLEQVDLTYTGVDGSGLTQLARSKSLRKLLLSHCQNFPGSVLSELAKLPQLEHLELRGCPTLSAADVATLASARQLRYLDLRDCQGRFRGQTESSGDPNEPPPPAQDGIGVTDQAIAALVHLPIDTLYLGGCTALTDELANSLAKLPRLMVLHLGNLPRTSPAVLAGVSTNLLFLQLDGNMHWGGELVSRLQRFERLIGLSLTGIPSIDDFGMKQVLGVKNQRFLDSLMSLELGSVAIRAGAGKEGAGRRGPKLTEACLPDLVAQRKLRLLDLTGATWLDEKALAELVKLPILQELRMASVEPFPPAALAKLATSRSLHTLVLDHCSTVTAAHVATLAGPPWRKISLRGTAVEPAALQELLPKFPNCEFVLPNGRRLRAP